MSSRTRLALVPFLAFHSACGEVCGPDSLASEAIVSLTSNAVQISWGDFRSSPNNDCGETGGPISLTLEATQIGEDMNSLVLCLPRPDKISGKTIDVGDATRLRIIDVFATFDGADCLASLDRSRSPSGSIGFHGVCENGLAAEGYSLDLAMTLPLAIMCGDVPSEDDLRFEGKVLVRVDQP